MKDEYTRIMKQSFENGDISELEYYKCLSAHFEESLDELASIGCNDYRTVPEIPMGISSVITTLLVYFYLKPTISAKTGFGRFMEWAVTLLGMWMIWMFFSYILLPLYGILDEKTEHGLYRQPDSKKHLRYYVPYFIYIAFAFVISQIC